MQKVLLMLIIFCLHGFALADMDTELLKLKTNCSECWETASYIISLTEDHFTDIAEIIASQEYVHRTTVREQSPAIYKALIKYEQSQNELFSFSDIIEAIQSKSLLIIAKEELQ